MSIYLHAKTELKMAGLFDKDSDYEGMIGEAVMELIEVFERQNHSGMSAPYVIDIFQRVANYKPLIGITGKDEEWADIDVEQNGHKWFQNKRCSALFKDGEDGKPYYIDAIVKKDQSGACWTGLAWLNEEDYKSGDRSKMIGNKAYVKSFPFFPKTFYIDVKDIEVSAGDWESFIVDPKQLNEVWEYYERKEI